jgi:NADH dehydrogenase FAD-containing subunit
MFEILIAGGGFAGLWAAHVAPSRYIHLGINVSITVLSDSDHLTIKLTLCEGTVRLNPL